MQENIIHTQDVYQLTNSLLLSCADLVSEKCVRDM